MISCDFHTALPIQPAHQQRRQETGDEEDKRGVENIPRDHAVISGCLFQAVIFAGLARGDSTKKGALFNKGLLSNPGGGNEIRTNE